MRKRNQEANGSIGLSKEAQQALNNGTYGKFSGQSRKSQAVTSQDQLKIANPIPVLKGMAGSDNWESSFSRNNRVDTDRARRNYADRIGYTPLGDTSKSNRDENYVVKRDRYTKLMKDGRLASDISKLAQINYQNANTDATVTQEWADEYGAKKITGGYNKSQFIDTLSRRYGLTPAELNDMALTFHSDAYKKETEDYGKSLEKIGKDHSVLGTAGSFVGTLGSGIEGMYNTAVGTLTNDDRYLSNIFQTTKKAPREGAKQNIKSNVGKTLYDVGAGIGDMVVGSAAGSAPVILAGNTANEAQSSAMDRGSSVRRSSIYGAGAGTLDYFTNKVGLEKAKKLAVDSIKGAGFKQFLKRNAAAGLGEGFENVLQDMGQSFLDKIVNGENSELSLSYEQKKAQGMSDEQAFAETAKEYGKQLLTSGAIGFGMGSAMQAGKSIVPALTGRVKSKNAAVPEVSNVDDLENATRDISNVAKTDIAPSIHNADGKLLDTVKVPEYTADSNVFFEGTDADISLAEAQDKSIIDTFKNIVSDPEFNALSFKNGKQEVYVSPSTSGNGYRVSYTIDGVPTGHHDYSVGEMDALSQNLRDLAGNGGEDIRIQRKSDISRTQSTSPVEVDPENVIYHSGVLSRLNKADSAGKMEGSRNTGYYGTGHYFVDSAHKGELDKGTNYSKNPYSSVDISKYDNLFRADTDAKASKLHDFSQKMMRYINGYNDRLYSDDEGIVPEELAEYMDDMYSSYKELFGDKAMSREDFDARINDFRNNYEYDFYDRGDTAFTTFMKEHGYNGVDTRGTNSADTTRGVVIYDLDEDSVLQSNVADAEAKSGLMNQKVRTGQPVFDDAVDEKIRAEIKSTEKRKAIKQEYKRLYDESNLKKIDDEIKTLQDGIKNIENDALPYYKRLLEDEDFLRKEAEREQREFEQFGLDAGDLEEVMAQKRSIAQEGVAEAEEYLANDTAKLKELQQAYDAEEAKSKAAYEQAKANIEGAEAEAPVEEPQAEQPVNNDYVTRQKEVKQAIKDHKAALKEQYDKYKAATNKKTRNAEYQKYQEMQKQLPKMKHELRNVERQINGLPPISDRAMDAIDAYKEDLRKVGNMYAGENGKALATEAIKALDKYEKSGVNTDFWDFARKVIDLKDASTEEYTSKDGTKSTYETWHSEEDGGDLLQQIMPPDDGYQPSMIWEAIGEILKPSKAAEPEVPSNRTMNESVSRNPSITGKVPEVEAVPPTPSEPVPEVGGKISETYLNTGKNGGGWNDAEYNKYTDPNEYRYETIDEAESVDRANDMRNTEGRENFKERVLEKERLLSTEIDGLMMEWRELTQEARAMEESGQDASAIWKESNRVFHKIQEQSTKNAQALQALAKWSRNTPEGMLMNAENILNGRTKVKKSALQQALDKFAHSYDKDFHFSDEFVKEFLPKAEEITKMSGDQLESREAKLKMAELGKMINAQMPTKLSEKVMSFLMDNMLGNFRTLITRNAGGNIGLNAVEQLAQRPLAAGLDVLVSKKTGKRTQAGLSREGLVEYAQGFKKGLAEEWDDYKKKLSTSRSGENTLENAVKANRHVFKTKVADYLDGLVKHGLSVGDRPFYEAVYKQTLGDYNRLRAQGTMGDVIQNLSDTDFDEYAKTAAKLNALSAVYQQDSLLSKSLLEFKGAVGDLSRGILGIDVLSQFSMPFVKTPANVIERAIDYSPLGIARNAFRTGIERRNGNFDQNRFVNESARNILGTALMGGAAVAAEKGLLSKGYSEDTDEKQAQKEAGMQEYALNLPFNRQMDIGWIPVVGSNAVASAATMDAIDKNDGGFLKNLATGARAGGKALFDQSMFQGLQRLFGTGESYNSDEGIVGNMGNVVKQGFGQAIPSLLRQVGQVTDTYQRDIGNSNEGAEFGTMDNYDLNSLANNIPGLRERVLAPKVNTTGELAKENQGRGIGWKVLEDMILPGKVTEVTTNALAEEAKRISDQTGEKKAYMPKASRGNVDTDEHTLTNKEWTDYQQKYYKELNQAGAAIIESENYKNADAAGQQAALDGVYSSIKSAINSQYNGKEVTGAAKQYIEAGGGEDGVKAVVKYYSDKIEADKLGMTVKKYQEEEAKQPGGAVKYAQDKEQADALGMSLSTYRKQEEENPGGAEAYASDMEAAKAYGFVKKDGTTNTKAYQNALEYAGSDPQSIRAYANYRSQGFTKDSERVPYLMTSDEFTNEQKGKIIGGANVDKMGKGAKGAYDIDGYEGVYYYHLVKYLADQAGNRNNDASKKEVIDLLNSNDPYVQQIPDDVYYYLPTVKW